ncbi:hypothetical protein DL98DRAFT_539072 [Cadophora sp. DSE1049]|nr:hypothetical protein DL98DRAFT_539072 [Cadophora sp. DSE1049]
MPRSQTLDTDLSQVFGNPQRAREETSISLQEYDMVTSGIGRDAMDVNTDTPPLTCTWIGCSDKTFSRKSDLKKHWEKHTKPYVCEELGCNGLAFGDKAGLHRHEEEKHGKHDARRYLCPVQSCPRSRKGFPRKRNRDAHVSTRHRAGSTVGSEVFRKGSTSATPEGAGSENLGGKECCDSADVPSIADTSGFRAKLMELEREREELGQEMKELTFRQLRKDEDIQALKRAMQLFAE